ncbi:MAG: sensor histidine kinase [Gemmatimonadaceae bacterium]|nr:sensor histidine kinase [Gemmatimonadaceae bacterium]
MSNPENSSNKGPASAAERPNTCVLAEVLASRMREHKDELTQRWLDRISARVTMDPNEIFPTEAILDHVPLLIAGIADYIEQPEKTLMADVPVVAKAMELGALRFSQGFDEYELLKEYEIFGGILFSFLSRIADEIDQPCSRGELLACAHRLFLAVTIIEQATVTHYLSLLREELSEREQRLRGFNRALTHEMKNLVGIIGGAAEILELPDIAPEQQQKMVSIIHRNTDTMRATLDNLVELSRMRNDPQQQRHVQLPAAVAEVIRQLREAAKAENVEIRVAGELPPVEVNAAAVELCLSNLVANAIKYSDADKPDRWVEISSEMSGDPESGYEMIVKVRDNGLGVPEERRARLFERFYRAHEHVHANISGTGLGLSIVRETVKTLGGRAWAEFPEDGAVFAFSIPTRRDQDPTRADAASPPSGAEVNELRDRIGSDRAAKR